MTKHMICRCSTIDDWMFVDYDAYPFEWEDDMEQWLLTVTPRL